MAKYCKYVFKKGSRKGTCCKELCHANDNYCSKHIGKLTSGTGTTNTSTNTDTSYAPRQLVLPIQIQTIDTPLINQSSQIQPTLIIESNSVSAGNNNNGTVGNLSNATSNVTTATSIKDLPKNIIHVNKYVNKRLQEDSLKEKILNLDTTDDNKSVIFKHYNNMKRTDSNSTEYYKNQIFVDLSLSYPWNKFYDINDIISSALASRVADFLSNIKQRMDDHIYGMESVKNEILNVVCKFITNPSSTRNNIALYGPAGLGKSKFIKILSDVLNIPMKTISLGGIKDSSFFLGHGYVYVESGPGKIIQNIIDSRISNPIMYFDELDKVSETDNGKDIFSFLCYLTDPTQNHSFSDHYFYGMHFDLSKVFYVFTFNDISKIDKILLDRLNVIRVNVPAEKDIINILMTHCIPEILKNVGIRKNIVFSISNIKYIINHCKNWIDKNVTSGIREYYRIIEKIILEINKEMLLHPDNYQQELVLDDSVFNEFFEKIKEQIYSAQDSNCSSFSAAHMYL